jgi:hypothetical protein
MRTILDRNSPHGAFQAIGEVDPPRPVWYFLAAIYSTSGASPNPPFRRHEFRI